MKMNSVAAIRGKLWEMELFFQNRGIWNTARVVATRALGNAPGYFPSGKKTFVTALNLRWDSVTMGNSNSVLYIGLTRKGWNGEREGIREASGYTSDKWWIGNKWGILTGNIRDIKKEPHALPISPPVSHISRDWNLTLPYYPNRTKSTFDEIWSIRMIRPLSRA